MMGKQHSLPPIGCLQLIHEPAYFAFMEARHIRRDGERILVPVTGVHSKQLPILVPQAEVASVLSNLIE
jgi:hypothetical protein